MAPRPKLRLIEALSQVSVAGKSTCGRKHSSAHLSRTRTLSRFSQAFFLHRVTRRITWNRHALQTEVVLEYWRGRPRGRYSPAKNAGRYQPCEKPRRKASPDAFGMGIAPVHDSSVDRVLTPRREKFRGRLRRQCRRQN